MNAGEQITNCTASAEPVDALKLSDLFDAMLKLKQERIVKCGPVTIEFTGLACDLVCYRMPRSKKRRTRLKWIHRLRNWKKVPTWYEERPGHVYCHPDLRPMLEKIFQAQNPPSSPV